MSRALAALLQRRLLIVSGARLEKQMAAKFNVAAELDERSGKRLDKPLPRRLPGRRR